MVSKRVSLKTIADITGVSVPTVSQILNNRTVNYSSEATRRKVLEAARELHYRPSFAYRLMQGKKTDTAAVLAGESLFQEEYLKRLFMELTACFERRKWSVYTGILTPSAEENLEIVRDMHLRGVEKVILIGTPVGWREIVAKLEEYGIPYVGMEQNDYSRVVHGGSAIAVEKIIRRFRKKAGRRLKLVCTGDPDCDPDNLSRFRALRAACPELTREECLGMTLILPNIPSDCADYRTTASAAGYEAARRILTEEPETEAIVFLNDDFALGGGFYLMEHPELQDRVRIAGYNNNAVLATFPVPVTTAGPSPSLWAEELVDSLGIEGDFERIVPPVIYFRERDPNKTTYPFWKQKAEKVLHTRTIGEKKNE